MCHIYRVPTEVGGLSLMPCPPADGLDACIAGLKAQGVSVIVSMLPETEAIELGMAQENALCTAYGIAFISHPIPDFGLPEMGPFRDLVHQITTKVRSGTHVVVHCRVGIGRSGMATAAALVGLGETAQRAQHIVSTARGVSIPDTVEQGAFIAEFARSA